MLPAQLEQLAVLVLREQQAQQEQMVNPEQRVPLVLPGLTDTMEQLVRLDLRVLSEVPALRVRQDSKEILA